MSDEPIVSRGVCHVIEHLALFPLGQVPYRIGGYVDHLRTGFTVEGAGQEVVSHLDAVTTNLYAPRFERLQDELRVLRNEEQGRSGEVTEDLLWLRYGAEGPGRMWYSEFGMRLLDEPAIRSWTAAHFTAGNAVAWLTAEPPADLRFHLPPGEPCPIPPLRPIEALRFPAWTPRDYPGIAVGVVLPRTPEARMGIRILINRLKQRLRFELGRSYVVSLRYLPLDGSMAHATLFASCDRGEAAAVRDQFVAVVDDFLSHGPIQDELDGDIDQFSRSFDRRDAVPALLDRTALDMLSGRETHSPAARLTRLRDVTPSACRDASAGAFATALLGAPVGTLPGRGWHAYPVSSERAVTGKRYRSASGRFPWSNANQLFVGEEGVSIVDTNGHVLTVLYRDCVLCIQNPQERVLFGRDGYTLAVRLADWWASRDAMARIDASIPPHLVMSAVG
jgi:zinc protease